MQNIQRFEQTYQRPPDNVVFCPYRVCPIGAHVDHQLGKVTGLAIDKGIHIAYAAKRNGVVELASMQFSKRAQWHIRAVAESKQEDWADYLRGATLLLAQKYPLTMGLCGVIEGDLPIGGLSSSAAVTIAFLSALSDVNGIQLTPSELIALARAAENTYVGVSCGTLDQSCEVLAKKGHLLYLDTQNGAYENVAAAPSMPAYKIAILFSGIERSLVSSRYNMRVDECKSAAYALMAFAGMPYGKLQDAYLRDVPYEVFLRFRDRLPLEWRKRAEHYYGEQMRVEQAVSAWRVGDMHTFGKLCFDSGKSSIEVWDTGSDEFKTLYECMLHTDGVYGGRFSGAGFKGSCMALIDPAFEQSIVETITAQYIKAFPALKDKFRIYVCDSADGVQR